MAVQPDKRAWAAQVAEWGGTLMERHRIGEWTLQAPERDVRPWSYQVRRDRPGFPNGCTVTRNPHDGWTIYDGDAKYSSHSSPVDCLRWWVSRQP
jgi:hypothetical protein